MLNSERKLFYNLTPEAKLNFWRNTKKTHNENLLQILKTKSQIATNAINMRQKLVPLRDYKTLSRLPRSTPTATPTPGFRLLSAQLQNAAVRGVPLRPQLDMQSRTAGVGMVPYNKKRFGHVKVKVGKT